MTARRLALACLLVASVGPVSAADPIFLPQGWDAPTRAAFYTMPQGSHIVPYAWALALEQPDANGPLLSPALIGRLRYLPGEKDAKLNPDGLPVGFMKDVDRKGRAWLGMNCSACHTGQITYQGKSVRVDGAPALADLFGLVDGLLGALKATGTDEAKFTRFAAKVLGPTATPADAAALRKELTAFTADFEAFATRSRPAHAGGFGRMDAFSVLYNEMLGTIPGVPANYRTPAAPVSYPFLWLAPRLDWVQWNGSVQDPVSRNLGEVVAVFGRTTLTTTNGKLGFDASMNTPNLYKLEQMVAQLQPPAWPEAVFGKIDQEKAKRGAMVYAREKCASCHFEKAPYPLTGPNAAGKRFIRTTQTPLKEVGTDPRMAADFVNRSAKTGKYAPLVGGRAEAPAPEVFFYALGALTEAELDKLKLTPAEAAAYNGYRSAILPTDDYLLGYKTGPLPGMWATAPYLHNGSVPSLYQLLLPPAKRVTAFWVGSREFDPREVGHRYDRGADTFRFDTSLPGNSNSGHDYGTAITDAERWDLIEYLKTF
jgi:hypothetical protein